MRVITIALALVCCLAGCGWESVAPSAGEERSRAATPTLAAAELRDGREVALRVMRDSAGPCLMVVGLDGRSRACGRIPGRGGRLHPQATAQRSESAPLEVYGAAARDVARVRLRYRSGGRARDTAAVLLRADAAALKAADLDTRPFAYFLAELPSDASAVRARGFAADGARLGTASYDSFRSLHPTAFVSMRVRP